MARTEMTACLTAPRSFLSVALCSPDCLYGSEGERPVSQHALFTRYGAAAAAPLDAA